MRRNGIERIVFSSSAAVYGEPEVSPISEQHPQLPVSPYGDSKRMVETILRDYARAYGLHSVSLRYFNAAGASSCRSEEHTSELQSLMRTSYDGFCFTKKKANHV